MRQSNEKNDFSTSILEFKKRPNKLFVEESMKDDNSIIQMTQNKLDSLKILKGEVVLLKGKKRKMTCAIALLPEKADKELTDEKIRMNKIIRNNLRVKLGDVVTVMPCKDIPDGKKVHILPMADTIEGITKDIVQTCLIPYFRDGYRPIRKGDLFIVRGLSKVEFKVVETDPGDQILVCPTTMMYTEGEPIKREEEEKLIGVGYEDVGGCRKQIAKIREIIDLPLRHPTLFKNLGVTPPKGVLLTGVPGSGKTLLARAIANETGVFFFLINGPEILEEKEGKSECNLRKAFEEAKNNSPSIIFIDELDAIAPKRKKAKGKVERTIVSELLALMDGLESRGEVIVMAATNMPNSIDKALRRFGRFDREINLGVPDELERMDILRIHTKNMKLSKNVDLASIAKDTYGFVGADLAGLCSEAGLQCIREKMNIIDIEDEKIDPAILASMTVSSIHFKHARSASKPSSLRELIIEIPNVTWEDIGGLDDVKRNLQEMILLPIEHPDIFEHFKMSPSKGVLFYGPSGCGKTLMAQAIAHECSSNFISVTGPELLTMYAGGRGSKIRQIFERARGAAPCILFFDELSYTTSLGYSLGDTKANDGIMNQLMTEMDRVHENKNVFFIGATNRPDTLNEELLRPGRFDQLIYIPLPDLLSRVAIFNICSRTSSLAEDVYLNSLADITEGFSGADIKKACQLAAKESIREMIAIEGGKTNLKQERINSEKPVPLITRKNFELVMSFAKASVTNVELERYAIFRMKFNLEYATKVKGGKIKEINWSTKHPSYISTTKDQINEEDIYS